MILLPFSRHKEHRLEIIKTNSDIKSAICGVSHGVVGFVVGSIHDLQTAATYMGTTELEISLEERIHLIEAVEQSQADQMANVGNWMSVS